jgi:hypothetical protein
MSSILATQGSLFPRTTNNTSSSFDDVSELDIQQTTTESGQASVSLSANLSGATAATGTGQLAIAFASAIQASTTVDPATGERELKKGASDQLNSAITSLLVQNGFSAQQAAAATTNLQSELSSGDPLTLSLSYDNTTQATASAAGAYGANATWTANSVTQTERSGSLNISIDASGTLSVALKEQTVSSAQYEGEVKGTGTLSAPIVSVLTTPGADGSTGSAALDGNDVGQGSGNGASGSVPAFLGFNTANQDALSKLGQIAPSVFQNGFGTASANSPVSESESDTLSQTALTAVMMVTTTTGAGGADGGAGSGTSGDGGQGGQDGSATQGLSGGDNVNGSASTGAGSVAGTSSIASTMASALKSMDDSLSQMLDALSKTTLLVGKDATTQLQQMLKLLEQAQQGVVTNTDGGTAAADASGLSTPAGASDPADGQVPATTGSTGPAAQKANSNNVTQIEIGFTQTVSIQITDYTGHGSTLYARPDGSLGSIVRQPTHVTA